MFLFILLFLLFLNIWNKWNSFLSLALSLELILLFLIIFIILFFRKISLISFLFIGVIEAVFSLRLLIYILRMSGKNQISIF